MTGRVVLVVAAALYDAEGRILLAQRPAGKPMAGLWEFPGGKVESSETPERALVRELHEELSIMVDETSLKPITFASHAYPDFHLLMPLYATESWEGELAPREGQALAWVRSSDLHLYPAPAADIPLFDVLSGK
ncbi:(deoxy)nucleoside triphosphate pyrophosphohydrolase [Hyphomonas sp.]|uniref:(deoxy)nucleoside triphosphate pyrophosphohydrolase n=1 Tax=Hyphomonas sp. TaxID=87 RepID=UPI003002D835